MLKVEFIKFLKKCSNTIVVKKVKDHLYNVLYPKIMSSSFARISFVKNEQFLEYQNK